MIEITIDSRRAVHGLHQLGQFPTRELMELLGDDLVASVRETIKNRRKDQSTGARFKRWSKAYKESGAPFHSQHTMLHDSGGLALSMSSDATSDAVRVGPTTGWGQAHVQGVPSRNLPKRDFLSAGKNQERVIAKRVIAWVRGVW